MSDDDRVIQLVFTPREVVMVGRALMLMLNVTATQPGWLTHAEKTLVEDLHQGLGMVVNLSAGGTNA